MKKMTSLVLVLLLFLPPLFALAADAVSLPELGVTLTPESGQALTVNEPPAGDEAEAELLYAVLSDGEGNRMNLWRIVNPAWEGLDLLQTNAAAQADIADTLVYGADYLRLGDDGVPQPEVALLVIGSFPLLGITYLDEAEEQVACLFAVLPNASLYCTFDREDGEPVDADSANALIEPLYSLSPIEE